MTFLVCNIILTSILHLETFFFMNSPETFNAMTENLHYLYWNAFQIPLPSKHFIFL